jgi:hypothetical protein
LKAFLAGIGRASWATIRRTPVGTGWRVASTGVFGEIRSTMEERFAVATDAAGSLPAKPEKTER